jgi:hypothetical protein
MRQILRSNPFARSACAAAATSVLLAAQGAAPIPADADHGALLQAGAAAVEPSWLDLSGPALRLENALPQDDDRYSVAALFNQAHGEFMQKGFQFRNNLRASYGYQFETGISGDDDNMQFDDANAEAFMPFTVDPDMMLILGARYGQRRYQFDTPAGSNASDETVYEAAFHVGFGRFFSEDLYVEAMFRPGAYTDFDGTLHSEDWRFYGDVIATYRFDPGFYGKIGGVYDGTFSDSPGFPVVGFGLILSDTFRMDLLAPKYVELSWIPDAAWIIKGGLSLDGERYSLRPPKGAANGDRYTVWTQELELYVDATMRLNDSLSFYGRGGMTLTGDYDWGAFSGAIDPAPFFEVGVGLNF